MDTVFFWHEDRYGEFGAGCLSQWADYGFIVQGVRYQNAEQFMMAGKAEVFHDPETKAKIMAATSPKDIKKLGREVKYFDEKRWGEVREKLVIEGNYAKFTQNPKLKKYLLDTGDALLVEASPYDKIWGIGLDAETAAQMDPKDWPGQNLLGKALMEVRAAIRNPKAAGDAVEAKLDEAKLVKDYCSELYRTDKGFLERVREGARLIVKKGTPVGTQELELAALNMVMRDEGPLVEFDRIYKPYVLNFLRCTYGFKYEEYNTCGDDPEYRTRLCKGEDDAEDVYDDVLAKLLCGPLWNFDLNGDSVGHGGFRRFLKLVTISVYTDRLREDLVPAVDADGLPLFTGEVEKDATGKPKLDENGQPIFKRKMVSKYKLIADFANDASLQRLPSVFAEHKEWDFIGKYMVRLSVAAYLQALNSLAKKERSGWKSKAMKACFEDHKPNCKLTDALIAEGKITSRGALDVAKHRFVADWKECLDRLSAPVINTVVLGVEGYSMKVVRQMKCDQDQIENYVVDVERQMCVAFGKERWQAVAKALEYFSWVKDREGNGSKAC